MTLCLTNDVSTRDELLGANRWEWRVFARSGLGRCVAGYVGGATPKSYADLYFVSANPRAIVKIRNGRVELKTLVRMTADGLELWCPELLENFPVSRVAMRLLCKAWHTEGPPRLVPCETEGEFEEFARSCFPAIHAIPVVTHRRRFEMLHCSAEHVDLSMLGERWESLALEDVETAVVRAAVRLLGLSDLPTSTYPAALARMAGIATAR